MCFCRWNSTRRFIPSSLKVKNAAPPLYKACAPRFIQIPFLLIVIPRPPKRLDFSNTITFLPAFAKYIDAVNPARPPPTIATSNFFIIKSLLIVLHTRRTIKEGCDMKIYFYSSILFHYFLFGHIAYEITQLQMVYPLHSLYNN